MKKLLIFLFGLLAYCGNAALVDYSAFRGTNEVLVASNTTTGQIIIGPATAISQTASNAAKSLMVWTSSNNQTRLSRYPAHNTNVHRQIDLQYDVASDDGAQLFGLNLSLNDDNSQSDDVVGIFSAVNLQPNGGDRALYTELGVWGLVASVDIGLGSAITNGETVALYGDCSSGATLQYGVGAHVTPPFNGQTNVGVASSIDMRFAPSALAVGAYLELTPVITNPSFEPAILLLDNRTTNSAPLIVGRTNNGSTVYRVNRDGSQLVAGFITNTALLPSKFVSTGSGTNLTSSAYGDSDIAGWLSRSNEISGYNNRIVQLKTNGTAVQTLPLGAIDLNIISSPTIGYQATNSAGENEIQFSTTAAVALTTDLTSASNALRTDVSNLQGATNGLNSGKINIQSGFANSLTSTNGTNIGTLTVNGGTATALVLTMTTGQTADLFQIKDTNGVTQFVVHSNMTVEGNANLLTNFPSVLQNFIGVGGAITNILTNGTAMGFVRSVNFTTGLTGSLASGVATVGISASASGQTNSASYFVTNGHSVTITNTAAATDVLLVTIPANTIPTNGVLEVICRGKLLQNSGGSMAPTNYVFFGGSNVLSMASSVVTGGSLWRNWEFSFYIFNQDSTTLQQLSFNYRVSNVAQNLPAWGSMAATSDSISCSGGVQFAFDTTTNNVLEVQVATTNATAVSLITFPPIVKLIK